VNLAGLVAIGEAAGRREQQDQGDKEQYSTRGAKLFEDGPEEFLGNVPRATNPRLLLG